MATPNEMAREWIKKASDGARQRFREAVRPIYGSTERGDPEHIGSGMLLDLSEGHFLLTAAHVLDWSKSTTLYLGADRSFEPLQFEALVSAAPGGDRSADYLDFALAPLDAALMGKLSKAKFISEADISKSALSSDGRTYTCLGYPKSKNKVSQHKGTKVTPALLPYTSNGRPASQLPNVAIDQIHVLVDYSKKYVRDEAGSRVNAIALPGCSGGAIIDIGRISLDSLDAAPDPKVAAMLIQAHADKKVIVGTRLTTILAAVRAHLHGTTGSTEPH